MFLPIWSGNAFGIYCIV